ncbi:MAG: ABC transporter ATP-binding protein [Bacteroidota bacterium]
MKSHPNILQVRNLTTHLPKDNQLIKVVDHISFDVYKAKTLGIVGESGSGKSMTALSIMRLLNSLQASMEGEILLNNINLLNLKEDEMRKIRGTRIAVIFQNPMSVLNPLLTIGYQIEEVLILHQKMTRQEAREKTISLLQLVGTPNPEKRIDDYPHQFSGGQIQRIMIAMALACDPDLLIADEPTTALDVIIQKQILDLIVKLQKEKGIGMIFITHDLSIISQVCHEVAVMYHGKIVEQASVKDLFEKPQHPYTKKLISAVPSVRKRINTAKKNQPLVELKNLSVDFTTHVKKSFFNSKKDILRAVKNVSLTIQKGEILGIVGQSGSGKTTLARTILKLIQPTEGQIIFDGKDLAHQNGKAMQTMRQKMQIIFQDPYAALNPRKNIQQSLSEPFIIHGLYPDTLQRQKRIQTLLDYVQLSSDALSKYPHEFSGGQLQRICIARALATNPEFIVCDESVSALDVSIQTQVLELFQNLQKELQLTYLFISHDLNVVASIADRVGVMYLGEMVEIGNVDEIYHHSKHPYTKALLSAIPKNQYLP